MIGLTEIVEKQETTAEHVVCRPDGLNRIIVQAQPLIAIMLTMIIAADLLLAAIASAAWSVARDGLTSSLCVRHVCVCVCVCVCVGGCWTGNGQLASSRSSTQHRHSLAVRQMQQHVLITDWALRPSAYPSVTQSVVLDGALHVCVSINLLY